MEMPQNKKYFYSQKPVVYWLWEPANPDATSGQQLGVDKSLDNIVNV